MAIFWTFLSKISPPFMPEFSPSPMIVVLLATGITISFSTRWLNFAKLGHFWILWAILIGVARSRVSLYKLQILVKFFAADLICKFIKLAVLIILWDLAFAKVYEVIHIDGLAIHFGVFNEWFFIFDDDFFCIFAIITAKICCSTDASVAKRQGACFYIARLS